MCLSWYLWFMKTKLLEFFLEQQTIALYVASAKRKCPGLTLWKPNSKNVFVVSPLIFESNYLNIQKNYIKLI